MVAPTYTPLPTPPARTDAQGVFSDNGDDFLGAFPALQTEGDALGVFCEAQAAIAESAAQDLLTGFTDYSGDMDALTSNGMYKLSTGATNGWSTHPNRDWVFHLDYGTLFKTQIGYDADNRTYRRAMNNGVWGAWDRFVMDTAQPSGTWTPTLTTATNVDTSFITPCIYQRVGDTVNFSGSVEIDPTAAGISVFELSLPIPSNFASISDASGVVTEEEWRGGGTLSAVIANDTLTFVVKSSVSSNTYYSFSGMYRIL